MPIQRGALGESQRVVAVTWPTYHDWEAHTWTDLCLHRRRYVSESLRKCDGLTVPPLYTETLLPTICAIKAVRIFCEIPICLLAQTRVMTLVALDLWP